MVVMSDLWRFDFAASEWICMGDGTKSAGEPLSCVTAPVEGTAGRGLAEDEEPEEEELASSGKEELASSGNFYHYDDDYLRYYESTPHSKTAVSEDHAEAQSAQLDDDYYDDVTVTAYDGSQNSRLWPELGMADDALEEQRAGREGRVQAGTGYTQDLAATKGKHYPGDIGAGLWPPPRFLYSASYWEGSDVLTAGFMAGMEMGRGMLVFGGETLLPSSRRGGRGGKRTLGAPTEQPQDLQDHSVLGDIWFFSPAEGRWSLIKAPQPPPRNFAAVLAAVTVSTIALTCGIWCAWKWCAANARRKRSEVEGLKNDLLTPASYHAIN
jgi:hypothetical protein